ncbi:hypothetical protein JL193_10580 [Polaribacter batillariae]|uniref:YARHG domain-containing protein n=1 Tax=Polaribacter batillariae TaxID=2808900 RepID=A0ABX7STE3_9FLAO|nr:hypothetical protein [Polaribacter batillariae]QTD36588.1 hypothetical protein JL193_10580 [Polaribacter batillariae]
MRNLILILALLLIQSCATKKEITLTEKELSEIPSGDLYNATKDFSDTSLKELQSRLDIYSKSYDYAVNSGEWTYSKQYDLSEIPVVVIYWDSKENNIDGAYLFSPKDKFNVKKTVPVDLKEKPKDGAQWYQLNNEEFLKNILVSKVKDKAYGYGVYAENNKRYLYLIMYKQFVEQTKDSPENVVGNIAYYIHEAFHYYPQKDYVWPSKELESIRFKIPAEYPADATSFSYIAAGEKLFDNILFQDNHDWLSYAKMQYIIYKKLLDADTSEKQYVKNYFLYFNWVEGIPRFIEYSITMGSGDMTDKALKMFTGYDSFLRNIKGDIEKKNTTMVMNGEKIVTRYGYLLNYPLYDLGASSSFILENLDVNVLDWAKKGMNHYEMFEKYFEENDIEIDEDAVTEDVKSLIPWEETNVMMQDYIDLWKDL